MFVKFIQLYLFIQFITCNIFAQNTTPVQASLPSMNITTEQAQNILTWYCQYDGVKSIAVQRSGDSVRNFTTIEVITAPKKGNHIYKDLHPVVGKNYYRLSIEFGGGLEWFSNIYKVILDSATIAKSLEERIKTGTTNAITNSTANANKSESPVTTSTDFYFVPSSKIFTNPYTGHININLEDASDHKYNIHFFDPSKNEVLKIGRVSKSILILDKNNFNSRGIYSFQLFDGTNLVETGYVNIY